MNQSVYNARILIRQVVRQRIGLTRCYALVPLLGILILLSSCLGQRTERLIEYIDPEGMVVVTKEEGETAIKQLERSDYVVLSNGNYLIHKSKMRTIGDYAIITAAAPVTITIDSAMYVVEGMARLLTLPKSQGRHDASVTVPIPLSLFK